MKRKRVLLLGGTSLALLIAYGSTGNISAQAPAGRATPPPATTAPAGRAAAAPAAPAATAGAPSYRNEALWPQPLPNHWVFGSISGVAVDKQDHVWVVHRGADTLEGNEKGMMSTPPSSSVCCMIAPSVLEFDQAGHVLASWGGPTYGFASWPQYTGGIAVDGQGNVWVAAYGLEPAAAGGRGGRGRGAAAADDGTAPAAPARGAAPAGGTAPAGGAAPAGRGRGGAAAGGAPPAGGAAPAAGGAAPAGGGRGRGGAAAAGGTAPPPAAPPPPAAAAAAPADQAPAARGRGAAAAPAAPALPDAHVVKYSREGRFIMQIGKAGTVGAPDSLTSLNRPAAIAVDDSASEVYIADSGNHRIVVFDSNTGAYKRMWGGSGEKPTAAGAGAYDPSAPVAKQFRDPTCVKIAKDGMVYVCDRSSDRIQVFHKDGSFVKEMVIAKETKGATAPIGSLTLNSSGSVWDVAFSSDAAQRWLFVADGHNDRIRVLRRDTLAEVAQIGDGGRQMGHFLAPGSVAVDSRGVLYTGEQHHAKRVQKFVPAAAAAAAPAGR